MIGVATGVSSLVGSVGMSFEHAVVAKANATRWAATLVVAVDESRWRGLLWCVM
jgi:hypothetical protein